MAYRFCSQHDYEDQHAVEPAYPEAAEVIEVEGGGGGLDGL